MKACHFVYEKSSLGHLYSMKSLTRSDEFMQEINTQPRLP
jgi:hypothetical protein